jgi:hypothetical protein
VSNQVGALAGKVVKHGNNIACALRLMIESRFRGLVTSSMTKGVNVGHTVSVREGINKTSALPAFTAHQKAVLQQDHGSFAFHGVTNSLAAMNYERH